MNCNKFVLLAAAVMLGLFIANNASISPSIANLACRSRFIANYTAALATYGSKARVIANPFYVSCYLFSFKNTILESFSV